MPWLLLAASAVALALVAVAADRALAALAVRHAVRKVAKASRASAAPTVRVSRAPFVPQLLGGRYPEVEVTLPAFTAGGLELAGLTARLTRLQAPLAALVSGRGVVVGELTATATVSFGALAGRLPQGLTVRAVGDDLRISGSVLKMPVSGTLGVSAGPRQVALTPKVAGVPALVGFVIALPAMPPQLVISSVRVTQAGLEVAVEGRDVVLGGPGGDPARPQRAG